MQERPFVIGEDRSEAEEALTLNEFPIAVMKWLSFH